MFGHQGLGNLQGLLACPPDDFLNFAWYCQARKNIQIQIVENGHMRRSCSMDDPILSALLMREFQWQSLYRIPNLQTILQHHTVKAEACNEWPPKTFSQTNFSQQSFLPTFSSQCCPATTASRTSTTYKENDVSGVNLGMKKRSKVKISSSLPKRPLSSFMLFLKENRPDILNSLAPGADLMAINKEAGSRWHSLPQEVVNKYKAVAKENMDKWYEEYGCVKHQERSSPTARLDIGQGEPKIEGDVSKSDLLKNETNIYNEEEASQKNRELGPATPHCSYSQD